MEKTLLQAGPSGPATTVVAVLAVQSVLVLLSSLFGGWLPDLFRLTHTRKQLGISFVGGLMFGIGMFHLLPHSAILLRSLDQAVSWSVLGTLATFILLRVFQFHHHDWADHAHCRTDGSTLPTNAEHAAQTAGSRTESAADQGVLLDVDWLGVALGLAVHTLVAGAALAAAVQSDFDRGASPLSLGFGIFLVILMHKPLDALSITWLLRAKGWSVRAAQGINLLVALMCPVGAALFLAGVRSAAGGGQWVTGAGLAFAAGVFLCISMSDLLPEIQFHAHDRLPLSLAIGAGVLIAYLLVYFEPESLHRDEHASRRTGTNNPVTAFVLTTRPCQDSPARWYQSELRWVENRGDSAVSVRNTSTERLEPRAQRECRRPPTGHRRQMAVSARLHGRAEKRAGIRAFGSSPSVARPPVTASGPVVGLDRMAIRLPESVGWRNTTL